MLAALRNRLRQSVPHMASQVARVQQAVPLGPSVAQQEVLAKTGERYKADHYYYVDIVGSCNLRCPSCAVGNYAQQMPKGLMKLDLYKSVVEKIIADHPDDRVFIDLYNWGEPVLHKQLPEIIRYTKERGIGVGISSNLNAFPQMREVVAAGPTYIRISISGYNNAAYQTTHAGGDINVVKANMYMLRHYLDVTKSDTLVHVGFHVYRSNHDVEFKEVSRLARELGFPFIPMLARMYPLEKLIDVLDGKVEPKDEEIIAKFVVDMKTSSDLSVTRRALHPTCDAKDRRVSINYDGSVRLCNPSYDAKNIVAPNFLDISREELRARRSTHAMCKPCMAKGLDIFIPGNAQDLINKRAEQVIGVGWAS